MQAIALLLLAILHELHTFSILRAHRFGHGNLGVVSKENQKRQQNVPGNLFVDEGCINCDACRWICPKSFAKVGIKSAVIHQPYTYVSYCWKFS